VQWVSAAAKNGKPFQVMSTLLYARHLTAGKDRRAWLSQAHTIDDWEVE